MLETEHRPQPYLLRPLLCPAPTRAYRCKSHGAKLCVLCRAHVPPLQEAAASKRLLRSQVRASLLRGCGACGASAALRPREPAWSFVSCAAAVCCCAADRVRATGVRSCTPAFSRVHSGRPFSPPPHAAPRVSPSPTASGPECHTTNRRVLPWPSPGSRYQGSRSPAASRTGALSTTTRPCCGRASSGPDSSADRAPRSSGAGTWLRPHRGRTWGRCKGGHGRLRI